MSELKAANMIYRYFGNSGLKVSVLSVGLAINCKPDLYEQDKQIIAFSLQNGINHFDTAQIYGNGQSEARLGQILKDLQVPREQIVIATKVLTAQDKDINSTFSTNRKHVRQSVEKSLKRLQLDYVDIIYAHVYDKFTPMQEICRSFNDVIERGLAFYWATSNWDAQNVFQALALCEKLNLHKPIGAQNQYTMLHRHQNQVQYQILYAKYNYGLVSWSPLCGGILTGKYLEGLNEDEITRFTDKSISFPLQTLRNLFYTPYNSQKIVSSLKELKKVADQLGVKLTHLALAWLIKNEHLDSAIIGARNVQQLEDSLGVLSVLDKFTEDVLTRINKILDNSPIPRTDFINFDPF